MGPRQEVFACRECGHESRKWLGQCPGCSAWNSYVEHAAPAATPGGRTPAPRGAAPVVVLGWDVWQRRFGGDPGVVGRTLTVNGQPFEVVGVTRPEFRGAMPAISASLYAPLMMEHLPNKEEYDKAREYLLDLAPKV